MKLPARYSPWSLCSLALILCASAACNAPPEPPGETSTAAPADAVSYTLYTRHTDKSFEDVLWELEFAISEHNYRITGKNSIGTGLRERGYDDFPDAAVVHFCSLERAREVLLLDMGYLAVMPCRIVVYEQGDHVIITAIMLPLDHHDERVNDFARETNEVQQQIVDFVLEEDS